ncbi:MAG: BatD family protein [Flectobacillus sp.]|uniref:BatD family protein n=1 Tax=Flectobacillus sp. TaxID=50419 RepID=UPI003B9D9A56
MKFTNKYINIPILFCFLFSYTIIAQENVPTLVLGEKTIALDGYFTITAVVKTTPEQPFPECKFPEFVEFTKRGYSKSIARSIVNGQPTLTYNITQNYQPKKEGTLRIKPFKVLVNGVELKNEALVILVNKAAGTNVETEGEETLETEVSGNQNDIVNVKENAFLAISTNKLAPFVGENFTLTLAFYVAENNTADIQFDKNEIQIPDIIKKIKPESCWEESFGLTETQTSTVKLNGKTYTQYKFYQATFYPLNNKKISIPTVSLRLLKDFDEKEPNKRSYVTFSSKAFTIQPKDLPPHPLKQQVSVGNFSLKESLSKNNTQTGQSVDYKIEIIGDGNISVIRLPEVKNDSTFDFFQPDINSIVSPQGSKIIGTKSFTFHIIPKQAGNFAMSKYFSWIFFNTITAKYDTLKPKVVIHTSGKTISTVDTPNAENSSVYDGLENTSTPEGTSNLIRLLKNEANIILTIMLAGLIYIFLPGKRTRQ